MVKQLMIVSITSIAAQVSAGGCWNAACPDASDNWGWCEDCGDLSTCCPPWKAQGCDAGKGCTCSSYGGCGTGALEAATPTVVAAEVRGSGCWNEHSADSAGNWGWCMDCAGGKLTNCCTPDLTYGCDGGQNCKCSSYNVDDTVSLEAATPTGCWNEHSADSAGNWGWCMECAGGKLTNCCTPDLTYGCDGGQNCQCQYYNKDNVGDAVSLATNQTKEVAVTGGCWNAACTDGSGNWGWCENCGDLSTCCPPWKTSNCDGGKGCICSSYGGCGTGALEAATPTVVAAEVRGSGCWNEHSADSAGNWGWCMDCAGGHLTNCCTPDLTYGCDGGQNCKCSSYNVDDAVSLAANQTKEVAVSGGGCWNAQHLDKDGNWGWCSNCAAMTDCCTPSCAYGCDGGKDCKCPSNNQFPAECSGEVVV